MALTSGQQFAVGARSGVVFELDATTGLPKASGTTAYEGLSFGGPKAFTLTIPEPRKIVHVGGDRVLAVDFLPATEAATAEIRVAKENFDIDAVLRGTAKYAIGEAALFPEMTEKQGEEPVVGLLLFHQSLDATLKTRRWRFFCISRAQCIPMTPGMSENPEDTRYMVSMIPNGYHLWGKALAIADEGITEAQLERGMSEYKPKMVAYLANGTEDEYLFPTSAQAADVDKVVVFDNGTEVTSGITVATTGVTFSVAPTSGHVLTVWYEVA